MKKTYHTFTFTICKRTLKFKNPENKRNPRFQMKTGISCIKYEMIISL